MKEKTTVELVHEIAEATDIVDFLKKNKHEIISKSSSEFLEEKLIKKGLTKAQVIQNSNLDKTYCYQIFSGQKNASRDKLIAIAFGMAFTFEETQQLLKIAGLRELYPRDERDAHLIFAFNNGLNLLKANHLLFDNGLEPIG